MRYKRKIIPPDHLRRSIWGKVLYYSLYNSYLLEKDEWRHLTKMLGKKMCLREGGREATARGAGSLHPRWAAQAPRWLLCSLPETWAWILSFLSPPKGCQVPTHKPPPHTLAFQGQRKHYPTYRTSERGRLGSQGEQGFISFIRPVHSLRC